MALGAAARIPPSTHRHDDESFRQNGLTVAGAIKQIVNRVSNAGYTVAGTANARLLSAGHANGLLYGPRSPRYGTD
ncbi:GNA1162 family protein [Pandoraea cepalis]|uniref:GNA1162 family protein n=1 Tax=Pandoraea cepalis TaxID=2508294 RepID=UPI00263A855C|nr:GNA1162 family protein [Pandoraea cepalis]